jgi:hypothetical protein
VQYLKEKLTASLWSGWLLPVVGIIAILMLSACSQQAVSIYNGCPGTYARITDGQNRVLNERLGSGERMSVNLTGTSGQYNQIVLNADGFRKDNNKPLGAVSNYYNPSNNGNGVTSPSNNQQSWNIYSFPLGCAN